ncbi:YiiX/YebB-like N1pC/P60 family cysteine hydrolase [Marinobacter sp. 1Y8]
MNNWIANWLAAFLTKSVRCFSVSTSSFELMQATLKPGDVLLVEGDTRISVAIQYLTQSTWSHAALYLGAEAGLPLTESGEPHVLVEADVAEGIRSIPLSCYRDFHTRICRPVGLSADDLANLIRYAKDRLGQTYDLKNVVDLARYLVPTPPVPRRFRRRMLHFGSGDPTRAICSTYIAQAFQHIRYPILPYRVTLSPEDCRFVDCTREQYEIRHHSLFVPRDFDASPYFRIVKPTLEDRAFDFHEVALVDDEEGDQLELKR